MSPRRLVAVSHTGLFSGAEAVLLRVAGAAAESGWAVEVLTPEGECAERARQGGLTVAVMVDLKLPPGPKAIGAARLGHRAASVARQLRSVAADADVVLVNGILALPALRLARLDVPTAWLVHDVIRRRSWRALLRLTGAAVDRAIAVSEAVAGPLRDAGLSTVVVRNGTPWPVSPAVTAPVGPPVVGCAALLTSWKGQDVLLEAVARLRHSDVVAELAGGTFPKDASYADALHRRAAQPDLDGRVRFLGRVEEPLEPMRAWTVATLPSVDPEAAPLALLEYLSLGLPTVATDHGGTPEVLDGAGILVPPRDPDALAQAIDRLLDDEELRIRCARAGRTAVAQGLTLERQSAEMVSLLNRLARAE